MPHSPRWNSRTGEYDRYNEEYGISEPWNHARGGYDRWNPNTKMMEPWNKETQNYDRWNPATKSWDIWNKDKKAYERYNPKTKQMEIVGNVYNQSTKSYGPYWRWNKNARDLETGSYGTFERVGHQLFEPPSVERGTDSSVDNLLIQLSANI